MEPSLRSNPNVAQIPLSSIVLILPSPSETNLRFNTAMGQTSVTRDDTPV